MNPFFSSRFRAFAVKNPVAFLVFCFLILLAVVFASCNNEPKETKTIDSENSQPKIPAPQFNSDSAFAYTKAQVDFGPRAMPSKAHEECAAYLAAKLKSFADTVIIQKAQVKQWDGKMLNMQNIIACFSPGKRNRVLLCTHWDSRNWGDQDSVRKNEPVEAANDGAAGVGVLLEIARLLKEKQPEVGVDIILLDAEDQGAYDNEDTWCLGSQYWAKNPHKPNYFASYGILLDMIGAKDAIFTQESVSLQYASSVVEKVWNTASRIGYSDYFSYQKTPPIIDDHYYINTLANIPCIDIIQYDASTSSHFYKNWHTHQDKLEFIDKNTLKAVGQTLLEVVYSEK